MLYSFSIPGTLPTLNEYVSVERTNRFAAAKLKRTTQERIVALLLADKAPFIEGHTYVSFGWVRPDMRSDKDNVAFAKKFILDALQEAGVIARDSWKLCTPIDTGFMVNKENPRVVVVIDTEQPHDTVGF